MDDGSLNTALRLFLHSETYILRHSVLSEERSSHIYLEHGIFSCSKHMRGYIGMHLNVSLIHFKATMCVHVCASICSKLSK